MFDLDFVPFWVWWLVPSLGIGGGLLAIIIFVPAALPFLIGLWNRSPAWVKASLIFLSFGVALYFKGRSDQNKQRDAQQQKLEERAVSKRVEVDDKVAKMTPKQHSEYLDKHGDYYD